jgi:HEPN domain-containing protein
MANRAPDWLSQSGHDLDHARHALEAGDYDWACFAAHQSAEKAVQALIFGLNGEAWGHAVVRLLEDLQEHLDLNDELFVRSSEALASETGIAGAVAREGQRLA